MSSKVEAAGAAASHVCSHCKKSFARLCDLNKHAKSHSRPYKCQFSNCKYHEHGWPTAKELERHVNDKHSLTPRTYACLFQPCPYRSKRESNCKQHMEKAHKWTYVRSKTNGKRHSDSSHLEYEYRLDTDVVSLEDRSSESISPQPQNHMGHPQGTDFILYDDQADAFGEDDDEPYSGHPEAPNFQTFLPWTSPGTRVRQAETLIQGFTQTYNSNMLDPRLQTFQPSPTTTAYPSPPTKHDLMVETIPIKVESPTVTMESYSPLKRKLELVERPSGDQKPSSAHTGGFGGSGSASFNAQALQSTRAPSKALSSRRDSLDEGSRRPEKKTKPSPVEDFNDTSMPDIFRFAHPTIYDRDQKETYSPCHTLHRDISTLVRHLSRPAHRFKVTERLISSFDQDEGFLHPRVGVCRWCWLTFENKSEFEDHVSRSCEKVSKGKREKWRVLLNSFTPLVNPTAAHVQQHNLDLVQESEEEGWDELSRGLDDSCSTADDSWGSPPTSVPSPTLLYPVKLEANEYVSISEHRRLLKEHQELREQHEQFVGQVTKAIFARQLAGGETISPPLDPRTNTLLAAMSAKASGASTADNSSAQSQRSSDQDNLVQHMDSQDTDVDPHGLMEEVEEAHKTLSRQNSGFSTTSTIHHVPTNPVLEYSGESSHGHSGNQNGGKKPPTSHADSGYITDGRRGSLAEPHQAVSSHQHDTFMKDTFMSAHEAALGQQQQHQHVMEEADCAYDSVSGYAPFGYDPAGDSFEFNSQIDLDTLNNFDFSTMQID
ncbi:hypothetical protein QBC35DRAFT_111964 [Podospora australis]|uniref:C2H2-type domain-containing protein n=1 Tax=Podospora australis TaxID=1536484 RepID=A0AAN6X0X7_9PEZI|nr:hypothetical protein QBC35DRAFT_111964 [Podospora australis]